MKLRTGLWVVAVILLAQVFLVADHVYYRWEWVDVPVHISGGFAFGLIALALIARANATNLPWWFKFIFVSAVVVMVGAGWEILEFVFYGVLDKHGLAMALTVRDTLGDLINDGIGSVIVWSLFIRKLDNK